MIDNYYRNKNVRLILGDSLSVLKKFDDNTFDMIFADPPYFLSNNGFTCKGGKAVSVNKGKWDVSLGLEADMAFYYQWISECYRLLKPNGTLWVSGTYHSIYMCGYVLKKCNFHILNEVIWFKPNASPNLSKRFFTASHETLIWSKKLKEARHVFNYEDMCQNNFEGDILKNKGKQMRSVWSIPHTSKAEKWAGKHPTQKPIKLLERVIISSTNERDLVLDPFAGTSTTGVVCLSSNRRYVGIDNNREYLEISKKRLEKII